MDSFIELTLILMVSPFAAGSLMLRQYKVDMTIQKNQYPEFLPFYFTKLVEKI